MNPSMLGGLSPPSRAVRVLTGVLAIAFLAVGLREVVAPWGLDATFGVPLASEEGLSFLRAVGARNAALSLIALFAAVTGIRAALASVFVAMALMAAMDFYIVSLAVGPENAIKHACFVPVMAGIALWVARSRSPRSTTGA